MAPMCYNCVPFQGETFFSHTFISRT
jgi:hypothetical protein